MSQPSEVKKGDKFDWAPIGTRTNSLRVEVKRVARDGSWCDLEVTGGTTWTKRQALPFPETFTRVEESD